MSDKATFIANSDFIREMVMGYGIPAERIVTKYLGAPVPSHARIEPAEGPLTILSVGRLVDFKAPHLTIEAFFKASKAGLDARLKIAGDGPLRAKCEQLILQSEFGDRVELLGAVESSVVEELLENAAIYTQHNVCGDTSGQYEAFGVSVIEAMAFGVPIVGTASGGVAETVVNGVTGVLVRPGDTDAHAEALLELGRNRDERERFGLAGRKRVMEKFTLAHEASALRTILSS
jgi:glycosyltransferase involved in cell wall biosynthesis